MGDAHGGKRVQAAGHDGDADGEDEDDPGEDLYRASEDEHLDRPRCARRGRQ